MKQEDYTTKAIKKVVDDILRTNGVTGGKGQEEPVNIRQIVESSGVAIHDEVFPPDEREVMAFMLFPNPDDVFDHPTIVLNNDDNEKRKRFAIAHSFGHLILHPNLIKAKNSLSVLFRTNEDKKLSESYAVIEGEANYFALLILLPENELFKDHHQHAGTSEHQEIAHKYDVDVGLVDLRLDEKILGRSIQAYARLPQKEKPAKE